MAKRKVYRVKSVPRGTFKLPIQTVTFVPSTTYDKPISAPQMTRRVAETRKKISQLFGGYTSSKAVGGYVAKNKRLIRERVVAVTGYAQRDKFKANKSKWFAWLRIKKKQWRQESIGIIIENDMFYI